MISERIQEAFNKQMNEEFFSAYLYLSMSSYFQSIGLEGMANWMFVQFQEEQTHALKFYNYIIERGGRAKLFPIGDPQLDWESPLAAFENALSHEGFITSCINRLVDMALEDRDHASHSFLQWYVNEQVEEEDNVNRVIDKLKLLKNSADGLFYLDKELSLRVFVDHTQAAQ